MEKYEYKSRCFSISTKRIGKNWDWYYMDDNNRLHKNLDGPVPTESIAIEEAKDDIRAFVDGLG